MLQTFVPDMDHGIGDSDGDGDSDRVPHRVNDRIAAKARPG